MMDLSDDWFGNLRSRGLQILHMDLTRPSVPWSRRQNFPAGLISVVGTVLLGIVSWHLLSTHIWVMLAETDPARFALEAIEAVLMTGPPLLLIYAGYWTSNRDVPRDGQWLLVQWVLVGLVSVSGVIAAITVHHVLLGDPVRNTLVEMELLTGAGVGCLLGFAVGNGRVESELRTATIEDQRDAFLFLNRLLRHHILNSIQIVDGYAARLDDYDDPELQQVHEIVRTRSQEITSFIRNIQVIVRTFTDDPSLEAVDLVAVVEAECDDARDVYEHAEIETDLPESIHVRSNESLAVVLRNLIDNAVQHNDQTTPRVRAEVSDRGRTVRLR